MLVCAPAWLRAELFAEAPTVLDAATAATARVAFDADAALDPAAADARTPGGTARNGALETRRRRASKLNFGDVRR